MPAEKNKVGKNKMTPELKEQLIKRVKSFVWRVGAFVVVSGIALIVDSLGLFNLDPTLVGIISLIAGEITKFVNTYQSTK